MTDIKVAAKTYGFYGLDLKIADIKGDISKRLLKTDGIHELDLKVADTVSAIPELTNIKVAVFVKTAGMESFHESECCAETFSLKVSVMLTNLRLILSLWGGLEGFDGCIIVSLSWN